MDLQVIDLTHPLHKGVPTWSGHCGFHSEVTHDYEEMGCRLMSYENVAGVGTHIDAPVHFIPNHADVSEIAIESLVAPLCIIPLTATLFQR